MTWCRKGVIGLGAGKEKLWAVCSNRIHGAPSLCNVIPKGKPIVAAMERGREDLANLENEKKPRDSPSWSLERSMLL